MGETFTIPVSNGILTPVHRRQMGSALWVFLWMIDRTTKEIPGQDGILEGMVLGGTQIRASSIAKDLDFSPRAVHEHIETLCRHKYVRRIDGGLGMSAGYAVQNSKKWRKNQLPGAEIHEGDTLAEKCAPSQESAHPRGFVADPRGKAHEPRGKALPILKTVQDSTEQENQELFADGSKTTKTKNHASSENIDRIYQAYPLKRGAVSGHKAIRKAISRLIARGETDPTAFLVGKISEWERSRARDRAAGEFVPHYPNPATWFNDERYNDENIVANPSPIAAPRYVNPTEAYSGSEYADKRNSSEVA